LNYYYKLTESRLFVHKSSLIGINIEIDSVEHYDYSSNLNLLTPSDLNFNKFLFFRFIG
jgi:hypothetical protein